MLVDFAVKNFLSFRDEISFSMLAAKSVKEMEGADDAPSNVTIFDDGTERVLKTAAIYGANGSGKSNLIQAFAFFKSLVVSSFGNDGILSDFQRKRFLFSNESDRSTAFEMIFVTDTTRFRYGFCIDGEEIGSEWLFEQQDDATKESYCFKRTGSEIKCNTKTFKTPKQAKNHTRANALFLTTTALFNVDKALRIKQYFESGITIISDINDDTISVAARQMMDNEDLRKRIIDFMKIADFGIEDIKAEERSADEAPDIKDPLIRKLMGNTEYDKRPAEKRQKEIDIKAFHNNYDGKNIVNLVPLALGSESVGTIKTFAMIGPMLDALKNGKTLIVDEFGASLHTQLSLKLLSLFQSKMNNGAQLIVTTHDTNLLRKDFFRRDQIWFVEKDSQGASDLYSLVEYKINQATSVRNDATFSKDYLAGKYGAIPHFGDITKFIEDYGK